MFDLRLFLIPWIVLYNALFDDSLPIGLLQRSGETNSTPKDIIHCPSGGLHSHRISDNLHGCHTPGQHVPLQQQQQQQLSFRPGRRPDSREVYCNIFIYLLSVFWYNSNNYEKKECLKEQIASAFCFSERPGLSLLCPGKPTPGGMGTVLGSMDRIHRDPPYR